MGFSGKKITAVNVKEMNKLLENIKDNYHVIFNHEVGFNENGERVTMGLNAWVEVKTTRLEVTYREGLQRQTYVCKLDDSEYVVKKNGMDVYKIMQRYYKVPNHSYIRQSASPLLYSNPKYEGKRIYAYEYDLNSAYAAILMRDTFPDTSKKLDSGDVKKGEIGFDLNLNIIHEGEYADIRFKTMESPYKKHIQKYYKIKSTAKDKNVKATAKAMLNFGVGYWQRVNPFLRAYVVNSCNEYIESLMDENTIMANTDAIFSLVKRPELELGNEIGQWKLEEGELAYKGLNYQWGLQKPTYRGIPKSWFKDGWDILKDEIPHHGNIWEFNYDKMKLTRCKYGD